MGSSTNNILININPDEQKQHCIFRKSKHHFCIFRMIKLNRPLRTNNLHSYIVKSSLISGIFKDLSISTSESAEIENIEVQIKAQSQKVTVKYSHIEHDCIPKSEADENTQKSIQF